MSCLRDNACLGGGSKPKDTWFQPAVDGSTIHNIQTVAEPGQFSAELLLTVTTGACLKITGQLVASQGSGQAVEVKIEDIHVYGVADTFEVMLIANSDKGCQDTLKQMVYVMKASIFADFSVRNVCQGDTVFFKNSSVINNDTFLNFTWDFGDTSGTVNLPDPNHIYKYTGTYNVSMIAISKNGFIDTISHIINILPRPPLSITYLPDTIIHVGQKVTLTANGIFDKVLWSTGEQTNSIDVHTQGLFSVIVTDTSGCKSYAAIHVVVLEKSKFTFMNVITPNGDGYNDKWKVFDIEQYQPCKLVIYNRWGDELYSDNNYLNEWNGTFKGKTLPEGTYYFVFITNDNKVYKGAINILK